MGYAATACFSIVCMSLCIRRNIFFAGFLPVLEFAFMCHFDAKRVHLTKEVCRRADTVPKAVASNLNDRSRQSARRITKENPFNGKVGVGLHTGSVGHGDGEIMYE